MAVSQTTVVLNQFGLTRATRTTGAGTRDRYFVTIRGGDVAVDLDPTRLGRPTADAIAESFRRQIRGIGEVAKPATIQRRQRAREAVLRAEPAAMRRYAGGRTLNHLPGWGARLFNDSGRLANSVAVRAAARAGAWIINVAANRFDPKTLVGGASALLVIVARLAALVPALSDAREWFSDPAVRSAAVTAIRQAHITAESRLADQQLAQYKVDDLALLKDWIRFGAK